MNDVFGTGRQKETREALDKLRLDFIEATKLCSDANVQAQILALRAHAEMVTTQMQSLDAQLTQLARQFFARGK